MFGALESHAEGMLWIAPRDAKGDVDFELSLASTGDKVVLRESSDEFFFVRGPGGLSGSHGSHGLHCDRDFCLCHRGQVAVGLSAEKQRIFPGQPRQDGDPDPGLGPQRGLAARSWASRRGFAGARTLLERLCTARESLAL